MDTAAIRYLDVPREEAGALKEQEESQVVRPVQAMVDSTMAVGAATIRAAAAKTAAAANTVDPIRPVVLHSLDRHSPAGQTQMDVAAALAIHRFDSTVPRSTRAADRTNQDE